MRVEGDHEIAARAVLLATGAKYWRLPVEGLSKYEGVSLLDAAGATRGAPLRGRTVGVVGEATPPAGPRSGSRAAARS